MKRIFAAVLMSVILAAVGSAAPKQKKLSKKEVTELVSKASTPAHHMKLLAYYRVRADQLDAEAAEHAEMAKTCRARPTASEVKRPGAADTASHCQTLSENLAKAAKDARTLSEADAEMAETVSLTERKLTKSTAVSCRARGSAVLSAAFRALGKGQLRQRESSGSICAVPLELLCLRMVNGLAWVAGCVRIVYCLESRAAVAGTRGGGIGAEAAYCGWFAAVVSQASIVKPSRSPA